MGERSRFHECLSDLLFRPDVDLLLALAESNFEAREDEDSSQNVARCVPGGESNLSAKPFVISWEADVQVEKTKINRPSESTCTHRSPCRDVVNSKEFSNLIAKDCVRRP